MKKLAGLALALVFFSCNKESANYTILNGKLTNAEENTVVVSGLSFKKDITLQADGTFVDTLYLNYNGAYQINNTIVYLENGSKLQVEGDLKDPQSFKFTGDLAFENNYLVKKSTTAKSILGDSPRDLYANSEADFLSKVTELEKKSNALLEGEKNLKKEFVDNEKKSIQYHKWFLLDTYKNNHGYLIGDPAFAVSANFPKADEKINYDDQNLYNFSNYYRYLVQGNFQNQIQKAVDGGEDYYKKSLDLFKSIKSQNIKNDIGQNLAYEISARNPLMEEYYKEIQNASTDEEFKKELTQKYDKIKVLVKGKPSPKFNYENYKGGNTSLDDLKGKYVYIDVWATWCGPCKAEIPHLKEVEKLYHGKNIEFVSISIDAKKDYDTWKKFVADNQLGGIQLFADQDWKSQFVTDYVIDGIPRFILVDPSGNIVEADAPRPSDKELISLFTELGI